MQEIKTFRRPIWKGKMAIPLLIVVIVLMTGLIIIPLYVDLQNLTKFSRYLYILCTGSCGIIIGIGSLNYIVLTETSIIFQNAIFPRVKNEFRYEELHTLSLYYPKG